MNKGEQFAIWCFRQKREVLPHDIDWLACNRRAPLGAESSRELLQALERKGIVKKKRVRCKFCPKPYVFYLVFVLTELGIRESKKVPSDPGEIFWK